MASEVGLEEQVKKVYRCTSCGRTFRLAKHTRRCPSCGGTLIAVVIVEK